MLVITASPPDYQTLQVEKERENLDRALGHLVAAGLLEIEWLDHVTPALLRRTLDSNLGLHILHYIGHGEVSERGGYLALEADAESSSRSVDGRRLTAMVRDCQQMRLVTLNTCRGARSKAKDPFASVAMALSRTRVPAVVAMQHEIRDNAAITFSRAFYGRLATGWSVYEAMSEARKALYIDLGADVEWFIPVLYSRSPDGIIFKRAEATDTG
jgi:hypothetical protein